MVGVIKRVFDITVSFTLLTTLSPLLLFISFLIVVTSGRPIVYKSWRIGQNRKRFIVYKFRSMYNHSQRKKDGLSPEEYITPIGKFLRATHIDEFLQLFNVLKGDMTIIGPRALDIPRFNFLYAKNKEWGKVLNYTPGITCLNQLCRYDPKLGAKILYKLDLEKRNRLFLDEYYINNRSFWMDLKIVYWTFKYLVGTFSIEVGYVPKKCATSIFMFFK